MCTLHSTKFNSLINGLRITPISKSRLSVPLCGLKLLPLVRPILEIHILKFENGFVDGNYEGLEYCALQSLTMMVKWKMLLRRFHMNEMIIE